jgi:glycosyltransferase involved in cell wall biosynthesis
LVSIITPHWNDFSGLENLLECLKKQGSNAWEWIIVDDASSSIVQQNLKFLQKNNPPFDIKILLNSEKKNASVCRNQGAELATYDTLVFLDSDDTISSKFVQNRLLEVKEFIVFQNILVVNKSSSSPYSSIKNDFLNNFLKAKFAWQTTSILFNKQFFLNVGSFDQNLKLLQDVEISIRILLKGKSYKILTDNEVDFFYKVNPIDINKRTLEKVTDSVGYLVKKSNNEFTLTKEQKRKMASYYFLSVRYFVKSNRSDDNERILKCLKTFYKESIIGFNLFLIGNILIKFYNLKIINKEIFIKSNRFFFKNE